MFITEPFTTPISGRYGSAFLEHTLVVADLDSDAEEGVFADLFKAYCAC